MKGYLINSLTPFVSSELDSRLVRTGNRVLNVLYSVISIVSILELGILDPLNFGHIPTAAVVFLVFVFLGVKIQKLRHDDFEMEKEYDTVVNEFLIFQQQININGQDINTNMDSDQSIMSESCLNDRKNVLLPELVNKSPNKRGRKKLSDGENPFKDSDYELFFRGVMETIQDYTLKGVDVYAIAQLLRGEKLNKGDYVTKFRASIPTIVDWFLKNYPTKVELGIQKITMIKAHPDNICINGWCQQLTHP